MSVCSVCNKPVKDEFWSIHTKCFKKSIAILDDYEYKPVRTNKIKPPKAQKPPKPPPKPTSAPKMNKIIVEKEYIPMINISYDPNDTTIYI